MGSYEAEMALVAAGKETRGKTCRDYFAAFDAAASDEMLLHRPNYAKTLWAPENDDIYQEFCRWYDQPEPRFYDTVESPISIEGFTAADIYYTMIRNNQRQARLDAAAVYAMLVKLRHQPEIALKVLNHHPTCYQCGTGKGCSPEEIEYMNRQ